MAIITDIIDERGHLYPQQYVNVHRVLAQKTSMDIEVGVYLSQESAQAGIPPHRVDAVYAAAFDMNSEQNAWQQAYVAIKQRWPDGVDC